MKESYTVALAGLETLKNNDGSFKKFSVTFLNNVYTWKKEHPKEIVEIIDARFFYEKPSPMGAVWEHLKMLSKKRPIDLLIYSGHSGTDQLYFFSKVRKELEEKDRYFNMGDSWEGITFSKNAEIRLQGCQTGGQRGVKFEASIAQDIADATQRVTYGYVSKSSQRFRDGGYRQVPDMGGDVRFDPRPRGITEDNKDGSDAVKF